MPAKVDIRTSSVQFLKSMALALGRTIDAGTTHNADGVPLQNILDEVIAQIPLAPDYPLETKRDRT